MPVRPVHDARHVDPALVGVRLVPPERRVARLRPSPRVVGVAAWPADLVEVLERLLRRLEEEVEELHLVQHAERAALAAGAVVGEHDDDRVVEQLHPLEAVHEPPDLVVGVLEERGERLLEAGGQAALRVGQLVPRLDAGVAGRRGRCRAGSPRAPAGGRTSGAEPRPSRRRSGPGGGRGTRPAPGGERGWRPRAR